MPRLETPRLVLRPPEYSDAPAMAAQISDYAIAKNTLSMAHPFTEEDARNFVSKAAMRRANGEGFNFSVFLEGSETLIGGGGLVLEDGVFNLGYWLGRSFWGQGYATEIARKLISFAFNALKADEISAGYFADNPASGHVLEKLGFVAGEVRQEYSKARKAAVTTQMMRLTRAGYGATKAGTTGKMPRAEHPVRAEALFRAASPV